MDISITFNTLSQDGPLYILMGLLVIILKKNFLWNISELLENIIHAIFEKSN